MEASAVRLPLGVRDFLPRAAARRRDLAERLLAVFEAWGYARIITPAYECADVLERGLGADARASAIRFIEPASGEVVALRPDITPQVARVVASRLAEVPGPLRLCYEGAVTRLIAGVGQREILQAGIELVDAPEPLGDAELVAVAAAAMASVLSPVGQADRHLDLGHVAPVRAVLAGAPTDEARGKLRAALTRKDRRAVAAAAAVLPASLRGLAEALVDLWGPAEEVLARAARLAWPAEVQAALHHLDGVLSTYRLIAGDEALVGDQLGVDLGDVRGFDYYTGMRIAGYVSGAPDAVLSGGRYDSLLARYGRDATATGFSVDIEALALAQHALGATPARRGVWLALCGSVEETAVLARELRTLGAKVAMTPPRASWPVFLRGANLDVAVVLDGSQLIWPDGSSSDAQPAVAAARRGDGQPLLELITARTS